MPDTSPILALPLIQPAQAQKHVTHNEALRLLDVLVQAAVLTRGQNTPPAEPLEGDRHITGPAPTGAWAGQPRTIAVREGGAWVFLTPLPGWRAEVLDEAAPAVFDGTAWRPEAEALRRMAGLGLNAPPDAVNRLTVGAAATLLSHEGAGHQLKINKAQAGDTASLLFQTGFSGRAEVGLAGQDDLSVKVSANGAAWTEALRISGATGEARLFHPLRIADGGAALPGLQFDADGDTGLFRPGADQVALAAGGAARLTAAPAGVETTVPLRLPTGTAALPALSFAGDTDTGLTRPAANQIGLVTGGVQRALLSTTGLVVDVPVSGSATTQSAIDATEGRLPRVRATGGIFGLGAQDAPGVTSIDDHALRTGFYRTSTTTTGGTFPPGLTAGSFSASGPLLAMRHDGGSVTQWWSSLGDAQVWTRRYAGAWSAWQRATRILGPVTQSGGQATGAILERGSNANGLFVRMADGLQICTRSNLAAANAATPLGSLFQSADVGWTFPAAFAETPSVTGQVDDLECWITAGLPTATACTLRALSGVTKGAALNIRAVAIGRWFV